MKVLKEGSATLVQPLPPGLVAVAESAQLQLERHGQTWWRHWDHAAIDACCSALPDAALASWPRLAFWRGLASFMANRGDALRLLDLAWCGFDQLAEAPWASTTSHVALVISQADISTQAQLADWLARAAPPADPADAPALPDPASIGRWQALWASLGTVAAAALGADNTAQTAACADSLLDSLCHGGAGLAPDERMLAGLLLLEYNFTRQQFHTTELMTSTLEAVQVFDAASAHMRGRWLFTRGYVDYQTGEPALAEQRWQRTVALASQHGLQALQVQAALVLARRKLETGRLDEADALLATLQPRWGSGRTGLLIHLLQTRARLLMLRHQPARALQLLDDALQLARDAKVPAPEQASCLTDLAEVLVALDRSDEALALLRQQADQPNVRNAEVFSCLAGLLQAWLWRQHPPAQRRQVLDAALGQAQASRFTMFFRQLPALAAVVCALALADDIATSFVLDVVRLRRLPAPADAGARWPWPLWLRLLGGFELQLAGSPQRSAGKTQHKPLELLRLLACERSQSLPLATTAQALWPEAETTAAQRNLEVAVHRLRKLLADASLVWVADGRIGLDAGRASSDLLQRRRQIDRLEALAMQAPPTAGGQDSATAMECRDLVTQVVRADTGALLPGAPDAPWLAAQRLRCSQDTVRAALCAAGILVGQAGVGLADRPSGEAERSLLEAALRLEPLADTLVQRLMQLHQAAGSPADALRVFEAHRQHLHLHGVQPGRGALAQWQQLQRRD